MSEAHVLPLDIAQKLDEAGISHDCMIFYGNGHWVYTVHEPKLAGPIKGPIDSLGPFEIHEVDISIALFLSTCQYVVNRIGRRSIGDNEQIAGSFAPIAPITLEGFARSIANIPEDATHFCWLYPPKITMHDNNEKMNSFFEQSLLQIGGFAYFRSRNLNDHDLQLIRINSLVWSNSAGLTFQGPYGWQKEFTQYLLDRNRFQRVTLSNLLERGARYFAFINPYEAVASQDGKLWTPSAHGAFAYLFNEDCSPSPYDCFFSVADDSLGVAPSD